MSFPSLIAQLPPFEGPFDARRLGADGCEVLFATYPPGTEIAPHSHETHNVGVITKGALFLTVDGEERRYGPGEWYEVGPQVVHAARFESETNEIELWFAPAPS